MSLYTFLKEKRQSRGLLYIKNNAWKYIPVTSNFEVYLRLLYDILQWLKALFGKELFWLPRIRNFMPYHGGILYNLNRNF